MTHVRVRRLVAGGLVGICAVVVLAVTASGGVARSGAGSSPIVADAPVGPSSLDLTAIASGVTDMIASYFYPQLTQFGAKQGPTVDAWGRPLKGGLNVTMEDVNKIVPYLVSWKQTKGGKVFTFTISPKARFSDGKPITSADVIASYQRAEDKKASPSYFWIAGQYDNLPKTRVISSRKFVFSFARPVAAHLAGWTTGPVSVYEKSVLNTHPDQPNVTVNPYWATHVAGGGGPYILDSYEPNKIITMHRNPRFFGTPAKSDKVIINYINDPSALLLQAQSGKADVTFGLAPQAALSLKNNPNINLLKIPTYFQWNINLNEKVPPLDNVKVREALTYAVPYQDILTKVAGGFGELYYGPLAHGLPFFNKAVAPPRTFNITKAQSLLKGSGVPTPLNLKVVIQQGDALQEQVSTILQSVWKQIGVNLTVSSLGPADYDTALNQPNQADKPQMSIRLDGAGAPYPDWQLGYDMKCGSAFNRSAVCIPAADRLLAKAQTATTVAAKQSLYDQITKLWVAQSPKIILFGTDDLIAINKRVKHFEWNHWTGLGLDKASK